MYTMKVVGFINFMKRLLAFSSLVITLLVVVPSVEAQSKKENNAYTETYDYDFKGERDVAKCLNRASAALSKNSLGDSLDSSASNDGKFGYVYGWSADGTSTAEISCDFQKKESQLIYARYSSDPDLTFQLWKALRDSEW